MRSSAQRLLVLLLTVLLLAAPAVAAAADQQSSCCPDADDCLPSAPLDCIANSGGCAASSCTQVPAADWRASPGTMPSLSAALLDFSAQLPPPFGIPAPEARPPRS